MPRYDVICSGIRTLRPWPRRYPRKRNAMLTNSMLSISNLPVDASVMNPVESSNSKQTWKYCSMSGGGFPSFGVVAESAILVRLL